MSGVAGKYLAQTMEVKEIVDLYTIPADTEIAAGETFTSAAIDLTSGYGINGNLALQLLVTGTGSVSTTFLLSADGVTYIAPSGASALTTDMTVGNDYIEVLSAVSKYMKLRFVETSGTDAVTINGLLIGQ